VVARVHRALEIIETRGDLSGQLASAITDNGQQKAFVLGPAVSRDALPQLNAVAVRVQINDAEVATGDAVLGHPYNAVARGSPQSWRSSASGSAAATTSRAVRHPAIPARARGPDRGGVRWYRGGRRQRGLTPAGGTGRLWRLHRGDQFDPTRVVFFSLPTCALIGRAKSGRAGERGHM
jgi:hypothetical protein